MPITAITGAHIFTVDKSFNYYPDGTLVMQGKKIIAVGSASEIVIPESAEVIDGKGRLAVLPGLIDVHSHSSLLKGFTENAQLMDWLPQYQREHQALQEQDAYYSCLVTYMEALKGGTTCILDMYRFMHKGAQAASELGIRAHLVPYAADNPTKKFFETLETSEQLILDHHGSDNDRIRCWLGLEHITYCSESMFRGARDLADKYGVNIHTHTSEQKEEAEIVRELFGDKPVSLFNDWGILKPGSLLAHCVWLDDEEISQVADTGTSIAHCPLSNMKLASGSAPVKKFWDAGITVGLGSDGAICNNSMSMWECMKVGSLLQKVTHLDATAVTAEQALRMATIEGAKAIGEGDRIGSLEVGKHADLITVDLWQPHLLPLADADGYSPILRNLIFAGRASDVRDVWVDGRKLLSDGKFTRVNEAALLEDIHLATQDFLDRRTDAKAIPMII